MLRRDRGGGTQLLKHLWPKLDKIVTLDWRMSTTARWFRHRPSRRARTTRTPNFHMATPHILQLNYSEQSAKPPGMAKTEWEIFRLLAKKIEQRAKKRGLREYVDAQGNTRTPRQSLRPADAGRQRSRPRSELVDEMVRDTSRCRHCLPDDTSLAKLRKQGYRDSRGLGLSCWTLNQASDIEPDETFVHSTWHTEKKLPYPTLTRRAQFYIDHPWFLEAGEELPRPQGEPEDGRRLPVRPHLRPQPLEHPFHEHHEPDDAADAPRPPASGDEHRRRGRRGASRTRRRCASTTTWATSWCR